MMKTIEELKAPIPGDNPAGVSQEEINPKLYGELAFTKSTLELMVKVATGEIELVDPKESSNRIPNWEKFRETLEEILTEQSKDFECAILYALARLKKDNLSGLRVGFELLREFFGELWDKAVPVADPDDKNPYWERESAIDSLEPYFLEPGNWEGPDVRTDSIGFAREIRATPFLDWPARRVKISLSDILGEEYVDDQRLLKVIDTVAPPPMVEGALRDIQAESPKIIEEAYELNTQLRSLVEELTAALGKRLPKKGYKLAGIRANLNAIGKFLSKYADVAEDNEIIEDVFGPTAEGGGGKPKAPKDTLPAQIADKADVRRSLDYILKYCDRTPDADLNKGPAPLILQGARRALDMGFDELFNVFTQPVRETLAKFPKKVEPHQNVEEKKKTEPPLPKMPAKCNQVLSESRDLSQRILTEFEAGISSVAERLGEDPHPFVDISTALRELVDLLKGYDWSEDFRTEEPEKSGSQNAQEPDSENGLASMPRSITRTCDVKVLLDHMIEFCHNGEYSDLKGGPVTTLILGARGVLDLGMIELFEEFTPEVRETLKSIAQGEAADESDESENGSNP